MSKGPLATMPEAREAISVRRRALIVDDEVSICALLSRLLARRDYDVTQAASCADVRTAADGRTFDVVLCDVRLGDGNGGDCLRHLLATQPDLIRKFVFITGDIGGLSDVAGQFADLPVLTKPFTASDLDRVLADIQVGV